MFSNAFHESPPSLPATSNYNPLKLLAFLAFIIFMAEIVAMIILYFIQLPNYIINTLLDGTLMLLLIFPGLYYLQLKPILRKIKEQEQAEQALRTSEATLKKILETLPVGVWIVNKRGDITYGNPAGQQIWAGIRLVGADGYREYKSQWAETGEPVKADEWAATRAITRGETSIDEEINIEAFDGTHKVILNSAAPLLDEKLGILGAVVVNQEITLRRQMERESVQINTLMERFFNSIHTLIAYLDSEFNFIRVNQAYAESSGHPTAYFIGKNHFDLYPHAENQAIFRQVVETGQPYLVYEKPFEYPEYPERGVTYWDWSLQPVIGSDNRVEGLVLSLIDVTRRKQAEKQLESQNQELRQLTETEHRARVLAEGLATHNAHLYQSEFEARRIAETMRDAAQALSKSLDLEQVIHTLLDHIRLVVNCDTCGVTLMEGENRWGLRALRGYNGWAGSADLPRAPLDEIITLSDTEKRRGVLILQNETLITEAFSTETSNNETFHTEQQNHSGFSPIQNWAVLPIVINEKVTGFVELGKAGEERFRPEQTRWAEALVLEASVAIQNAWLFEQVRSSSIRLQSLARKLVELQEKERFHIARELHDEAGQLLTSLKLNLGRLEQDPDCPESIRKSLNDLKIVTDGVLEDLHRLAMDLRPVALDHLGLVPALEQLAHQLNSEKLSVKFRALGFEGVRLPQDVETSLYRIVQEALTNVLHHAQASSVGVLLEHSNGRLKLFVEDDGVGFKPDQAESGEQLGLVGMRERAEMFGGNLSIESSPDSGTSIIVEVPDANPNLNYR